MIDISDKAPDFQLIAEDGSPLNLKAFKGRKLVLYFYPKDDTPGCTKEAISFSEHQEQFSALGADILGVSKDTPQKHAKFREKHSLTVPLASDKEGTIFENYGAWVEKNMYGRKYMGIERSTFLIDEKGILRQIWRKVRVAGHIEAVLDEVTLATARSGT